MCDDVRPALRITNYKKRAMIAFDVDTEQVSIIGVFYGGQDYETFCKTIPKTARRTEFLSVRFFPFSEALPINSCVSSGLPQHFQRRISCLWPSQGSEVLYPEGFSRTG